MSQPRPTLSALWRLARPRGMVLVLSMPTLGYGFGHWEWALPLQQPDRYLVLLAGWWLLSAGTLWLNAAFDGDEGDVLMGSPGRREQAPRALWSIGIAALAASVVVSCGAGAAVAALDALCALLAVAYSHPRTAWKAHPTLGPLVNIAGYGLLSPAAGFVLTGVEPTVRTLFAAVLVASWVGATYFGAQAFQADDDSRRGYRTLVVTHGPRITVLTARALYAFSILGFLVGALYGFFPRPAVLVLFPWLWLDHHLARWASGARGGISAARVMLQRATVLGASLLALVTADHLWHFVHHAPPAGLGTRWRPNL